MSDIQHGKKLDIAASFMQSLLASPVANRYTPEQIAIVAVNSAEALIKELEKREQIEDTGINKEQQDANVNNENPNDTNSSLIIEP